MKITWVLYHRGWYDGSLLAAWVSRYLVDQGIGVTIQPLYPPLGAPMTWDDRVVVADPLLRPSRSIRVSALSRWCQEALAGADGVVVDQDFETEIALAEAYRGSLAPLWLVARQWSLPANYPLKSRRLEGIIAISRLAFWAHQELVEPSRLWLLPIPRQPDGLRTEGDRPVTGIGRLVVAGPLLASKAVDFLLNVLAIDVASPKPLTVLGDGGERERLAVLAKAMSLDVAFWPSPFGWEDVIKEADWLVAPQVEDSLAGDVALASALGTPIIASDRPLVRERLAGEPQAVLVPALSPMDFFDALSIAPSSKRSRPEVWDANQFKPWMMVAKEKEGPNGATNRHPYH